MRDGATPSFDPLPRKIRGNFIFANYGADQAVDNDDGSSYFHVLRNLFYDASGFKMDYGGHDSLFEENLVMAMGRKKCIGFGSFKEGHGDIVQNNTCIVGLQKIQDDATNSADGNYMRDPTKKRLWSDHEDNVASLERCEGSNAILRTNKYYTPHGNASFTCSYAGGGEISLEEVQTKYGLDLGSTTDIIPPVHILLYWARQLLFLEEADSASWV